MQKCIAKNDIEMIKKMLNDRYGIRITYRVDKEKYLVEYLKTHPNENKTRETLDRVRAELLNLYSRKGKIEKAQTLYEIKNDF